MFCHQSGTLLWQPAPRHRMKCHSSASTPPHTACPTVLSWPCVREPPASGRKPPEEGRPFQPITTYPARGKNKDLQEGGLLGEAGLYPQSALAEGWHSHDVPATPGAAHDINFIPVG